MFLGRGWGVSRSAFAYGEPLRGKHPAPSRSGRKLDVIFVTGGARSGKSSLAERLASEGGRPVTYIATARPGDQEMQERIAQHRQSRPGTWTTVESPSDLPRAVADALAEGGTVLVDCLTLYISNLLMSESLDVDEQARRLIDQEIDKLAEICASANSSIIIVSNEVGMGIVPDNALARAFRDVAGRANQKMAAAADNVYFCVSGIPVKVK